MSNYILHSAVYSAESVSANTDITENFVPENSVGFVMVAAEINCSGAAVIAVNDTDKVQCLPDRSGYTARINMGGSPFIVPLKKLKIETACDINSCTVYYSIDGFKRKLAPPSFSVPAGGYPMPVHVMLDAEEGCDIYYTTNGSAPTTDSAKYEGGVIELSSGATIKAIAVKGGCITSDAGSAQYTKLKCATPVADPAAGEVESGTEVELTTETAGAAIYYSADGSTPATLYTEPIKITANATIKAVAKLNGATNSDQLSATYTIASGS